MKDWPGLRVETVEKYLSSEILANIFESSAAGVGNAMINRVSHCFITRIHTTHTTSQQQMNLNCGSSLPANCEVKCLDDC